ncbi:MAG: SPW repeat protein [Actinobacteria bacterium]|nr:SPW repeat protein [Actinomycetota bacterium]
MGPTATFMAAIWLASAPWRHGYADDRQALADALLVGTVVTMFTLWRRWSPPRTLQLLRASAALGGWAVVAPWLIGYRSPAAAATTTAVGATIILLSGWGVVADAHRTRGERQPSRRNAKWN